MTEKHRWYDVIAAWASGEKIQYNFENLGWRDYRFGIVDTPGFNNADTEWRIKPRTCTKKYRMALVYGGIVVKEPYVKVVEVTNSSIDDPVEYKLRGFIRWIGDIAEVEITCD